jgi:hypothetical protein
MNDGEIILRVLVFMLFIPAVGAVGAYVTGHPSAAMVSNGVVPLLVLLASAVAFLNNPTTVTVGGMLYFVVPLGVVMACAAGLRRHRLHPALFWLTWAVNLAIVAFLFYLSFMFKIF